MPYMTQTSTNVLRAPHTPTPSPSAGLQDTNRAPQKAARPHRKTPPAATAHGTPEPTPHPRDHPAPPSPAKPTQGHPYIDADAQDPGSPPSQPPPDAEHPPLTPTTIRDPDHLRATLQSRALSTPLGWYRLQESWTKFTVKALQDLTTPGNGLHEAIVDLVLWRARQHAQGQHV